MIFKKVKDNYYIRINNHWVHECHMDWYSAFNNGEY